MRLGWPRTDFSLPGGLQGCAEAFWEMSCHSCLQPFLSADYFSAALIALEAKIRPGEGKGRLVGNPSLGWRMEGCAWGLAPCLGAWARPAAVCPSKEQARALLAFWSMPVRAGS